MPARLAVFATIATLATSVGLTVFSADPHAAATGAGASRPRDVSAGQGFPTQGSQVLFTTNGTVRISV